MKEEKIKCIEWHISNKCNYNCSYCLRADTSLSIDLKNSYESAKITENTISIGIDYLLNNFKNNFPGSWYFLISGSGEPFIVENFLHLIERLVESNYKIAVQTNLSLPIEKYIDFCKICGDKLIEIRASLHLEKVDSDKFLSKILAIKKYVGEKIKVRTVAREKKVLKLLPIYKKYKRNKIDFYFQLEKKRSKNGVIGFSNYCEREMALIKIVNSNIGFIKDKNFLSKGKRCLTGLDFVLINEQGNVWSCTPAQRDKNKKLNFGNIYFNKKIYLPSKSHICKYKYCYCPMPIHLGLIK